MNVHGSDHVLRGYPIFSHQLKVLKVVGDQHVHGPWKVRHVRPDVSDERAAAVGSLSSGRWFDQFVEAACATETNPLEYRGVWRKTLIYLYATWHHPLDSKRQQRVLHIIHLSNNPTSEVTFQLVKAIQFNFFTQDMAS
jgi:hypothetical protein